MIHISLLVLSLVAMGTLFTIWSNPILPDHGWKPDGLQEPVPSILTLLLLSIGFPFLLLSSTSPLLQKWMSLNPHSTPYKLYAVSNAGSLLALLSYPFLFEPNLSVRVQSLIWSAGYVLFTVCSVLTATKRPGRIPSIGTEESNSSPPASSQYALWIGLSGCGVLMLLAVTNQVCREVAVVPFLWIVPLAIYLLTFILCFEQPRIYSRTVFHLILIPVIVLSLIVITNGVDVPILYQIVTFTVVLFVCCMICHGELYRMKPKTEHLTHFYVSIAAGGAVGGTLSAIAAPLIMKGFWEFHLGLLLTAFLAVMALHADDNSWIHRYGSRRTRAIRITLPLVVLAVVLAHQIVREMQGSVLNVRNFYGVLTVLKENEGTKGESYTLRHGRIRHGYQFTDAKRRMTPTSYYAIRSGIGRTLKDFASVKDPIRVGIIGLGVGTIAAYGRAGDTFRFYEIDRDVADLAQSAGNYFHFLAWSPAETKVILGDGRISLEREANQGSQNFDVLAVDAFNSDSIPAHLLTQEAMEIYLYHLKKPSGILAFHISNRFLNLKPVVLGNAQRFGLRARMIESTSESDVELASTWLMLSPEKGRPPSDLLQSNFIYWTDDYHSILPILEWSVD